MLTPMLNWSNEIRLKARAITVCWGLLIFAALIATSLNVWRENVAFSDIDQTVTCDYQLARNCTLLHVQTSEFAAWSSDFYDG